MPLKLILIFLITCTTSRNNNLFTLVYNFFFKLDINYAFLYNKIF